MDNDDLRRLSHPACFPINFTLDKKRIKEEEFGLVNYPRRLSLVVHSVQLHSREDVLVV